MSQNRIQMRFVFVTLSKAVSCYEKKGESGSFLEKIPKGIPLCGEM